MIKLSAKIENLISSLPDDNTEKPLYRDSFKKYVHECGCSLGAKFLAISIAIFIVYVVYLIFFSDLETANILALGPLGIFFVFISGIVGKLIGIGIAKLKLALFYRNLIDKYHIRGR